MTQASRRNVLLRLAGAVVGLVVVVALAITGGLMVGERTPAGPAGADDHATAPACNAALPQDVIEAAVPSAVLDAADEGPLSDGTITTCAWSATEGPARALTLAFSVYFTDSAAETTGEELATTRLERLTDASGADGTESVDSLGDGVLVWPDSAIPGSAQTVFRDKNLVVRVWYSGTRSDNDAPLPYTDARDTVVDLAEQLASSL
ncbi:hypothetical protein [Nocardiopsis ansamitocini]|uniref:DUF3558 domain-containing protein n=1 Tax=Nocardiopsis ansamitocini TaxID=1670832 RepID=A0A9W6P6N2_9ACTN|nr:hypothetical protein [Nocardiopsis ansamitocini]GLU48021.1 hypothetical protein Nans01_23720 [Nocardiopsis ansamitocini]